MFGMSSHGFSSLANEPEKVLDKLEPYGNQARGACPFLVPLANQVEVLRRVEQDLLPPLVLTFAGGAELRDLIAATTQKRRDLRPRTAEEAFVWMQEIGAQFGL